MTENKKTRALVILFTLSSILILGYVYMEFRNQDTLTIGVFSGSSWDVPGTDYYNLFQKAIEKFQEENPNIKIVFEEGIPVEEYSDWLAGEILKGTEPDIFLILPEDYATLIQSGSLKRLNKYILRDMDFNSEIFYESAYDAGQQDGMQYALPFECNPKLMFVNKTLLKKSGIDIPSNDWTWDDFYESCNAISKVEEEGKHQYGYYGYSWQDAIYSNGARPFLEDGSDSCFTDSDVIESVLFTRKMTETYGDHTANPNDFDLGKVAFRPLSFSEYRTYMPYPWRIKKFVQFEWNCLPMPAGPKGGNISSMETLLLGMSCRTKSDSKAWEFMKLLTSDEEIQTYIYTHTAGVSPVKNVTCSQEVREILNKDTPGDSEIDMSLLDLVMDKAVNENQFKGYENILQYADQHIESSIKNGDEMNLSLFQLKKDLRKIMK